jgi:hypothetical protein
MEVGEYQLGRRAEWGAFDYPRQDQSSTACFPAQSTSSQCARESLETCETTGRGMGVARRNQRRTHQSRQREAPTQEGSEAGEDSPIFEVYSIRHTFLTRLGESGCDAWTLARIAGHSNISISQRYVHPSEDAVLNALSRLGGHNSGHSVENATLAQPGELPPNTDNHEG